MLEALGNVFRVPELKKKIIVTVVLLLIYRLGYHIPVPGVNYEVVRHAGRSVYGALGDLVGVFNTISGGNWSECALFSLGIMPYISASIIFSLLVKVVPALEKLSKEGATGTRKINQYTRYLTVPICMVQSFFVIRGVMAAQYDGQYVVDPELYNTFWFQFVAMTALTGGAIFLMWLGEQITEYGIGNGVSLLIMSGIVARIPEDIIAFIMNLGNESERLSNAFVLVALFVGVVIGVVYITKGQRRIPIQQQKLTRGTRVYGGSRHYLPFRVNASGVMPIIFAQALLVFPPLLFEWIGKLTPQGGVVNRIFTELGSAFSASSLGFAYLLFYVGMIYFFSFFWTALMFQPTEIANNMKEYGSFIPGIRPGTKTAQYLEKVTVRVTLIGSSFLAMIALFPQIVASAMIETQSHFILFLGGTTILIVVGVALDLVDKVNSYLLMRDYEGFIRKGRGRSVHS